MSARYWLIVPAAGRGTRMGTAQPKQYLPLLGRTVLEWSLQPFVCDARIAGIVVVLAEQDRHFKNEAPGRIRIAIGGAERAESVRAGLTALAAAAASEDWVMVHDAARPCLHEADLNKLIERLQYDAVGGLLATPLADTLKQADEGERVSVTLPRANLWRALTPQMFRYGLLNAALENAARQNIIATDEAAAIELLGHAPQLIAGRADNIKITVPEDLILAEAILNKRIDKL